MSHPNTTTLLSSINKKIISTSQATLKGVQAVGLYGYEPVSGLMNRIESSANNELKVIVPSGITINNSLALSRDGAAQVLLSAPGGTAVRADSSCVIQQDPELRLGWNMTNSAAGKFNLYYFNGLQENMTLYDLQSVYFRGAINVNAGTASMPFIHVYTKPTGTGDAGAFYHSLVTYTFDASTDTIGIGEECLFYAKTIDEQTRPPQSVFSIPRVEMTNRKIALTNKILNGDGFLTEEILYIVVASDSGAPIDTVNVTLNLLGFNTAEITRNLSLEAFTEVPIAGDATAANQVLSIASTDAIKSELTSGLQQSKCMGSETGFPLGTQYQIKTSNAGRLEVDINSGGGDASAANQTNGNQKSMCMGSFGGAQVQLKVDVNGVLETSGGGGGGGGSTQYDSGSTLPTPTVGTAVLGVDINGLANVISTDGTGKIENVMHGRNTAGVAFPVKINQYSGTIYVKDFITRSFASSNYATISAGTTYQSSTVNMTSVRNLCIFGNTTNLTDKITLYCKRVSSASYPTYKMPSEYDIIPDSGSGDFFKQLVGTSIQYLVWGKDNSTGADETIEVHYNYTD